MASKRNGTLYVGITNDLMRRVQEHKLHKIPGFTKRYNITTLVWYEETNSVEAAIQKEKQLKKWRRAWKIRLIEECNPKWIDLSKEWEL
jgi:putative endonuclease